MLLLLGLTLTLNIGLVSAAESPNISTQTLQSSQYTNTSKLNTSSTTTLKTTGQAAAGTSTSTTKTIRVLIYNGNGAITNCVNGIKIALDTANNNNLVPGYRFTYTTSNSNTITSSYLSNFDLLAMPGGSSGYTYINSVSATAIRNFVSSGHGYLGICAGAYSGSNAVYSGSNLYYNAWGVAPHVYSKVYNHEGNLQVSMTSSATQLLGTSGTTTLVHYNGPAMYGSGFTRFANYASGIYSGYAAIVGDTYGSGRSVLSGPHPELTPMNSTLVAKLIVWAANVQSTPTNTVTVSQIGSAAKTVKTYYEANKRLPSYVTISGKQITMPGFFYLLTYSIINVNSGSLSSITLKTVNAPTAPKGTFKSGNIFKTEYVKIASNIRTYINTYGRAPNYVACSLGNIRYESAIYMYSKLMNFYYTNQRLPSYVSM